jgi:drug/metabolite transporter (DMT)-like permease
LLLLLGLASTPPGTASLLLNLEGVATAVLAWLVFREHYDRRIVLGMLLVFLGSAALAWSRDRTALTWESNAGPLLIAGACLAWGIDNNLTKKIAAGDALQIAMTKGLAAGTMNTALALASGEALPAPAVLAGAAVVGFLGYGVSLLCFVLSLRHIGAARTGAYFSSAPFVGAVLAVGGGAEPLTLRLGSAAALMGAGLWLHLAERHEHEHEHEVMEHEHLHHHDEHHQHEHAHDPETPTGEPHSHRHRHERLVHTHVHWPDAHHGHRH